MAIIQYGSSNLTAQVVPQLLVQVVPPQNLILNGVPSNVVGIVGTSTWGPIGQASICANMADYQRAYGPLVNRKYDMGTQMATAVQQGASNFRCVRVTDATDTAAVSTGVASCITFTAFYTGSLGNNLSLTLASGSKAASWKVNISLPNQLPEVFDNITGTGNAFWVALASAINNGNSITRGPSHLVVATAASGTTAAAAASFTFFGGGDGAGVTYTNLIGTDSSPRLGMYALRGQGCSIALLADADNSASWSTQGAYGLSEGTYMIMTGPSGDTISNAVTTKASAGIDNYACKLMFGDWLYWNDAVSGVMRLVSPQGFVAGRMANQSPEQSSLNKQIYSIVSSQRAGAPGIGQATTYSDAELQTLFQVGIDVISNPVPGGNYWGVRAGRNTSSNSGTNGDNYTRMTNYIAATLNAGMGLYIGQVINAALFRRVKATLTSLFQNMLSAGQLGSLDGTLPYAVICDSSNNPLTRTSLGYLQADTQVQYQGIVFFLVTNLEGGQTVTILKQTTQTGQLV